MKIAKATSATEAHKLSLLLMAPSVFSCYLFVIVPIRVIERNGMLSIINRFVHAMVCISIFALAPVPTPILAVAGRLSYDQCRNCSKMQRYCPGPVKIFFGDFLCVTAVNDVYECSRTIITHDRLKRGRKNKNSSYLVKI